MRESESGLHSATRPVLLVCEGDELSVVHADAACCWLLGAQPQTLLGRRLVDLASESGRGELRERLAAGPGGDGAIRVDTTLTRENGSSVQVRMQLHRLPGAAGALHAVVIDAERAAPGLDPDDPSFREFVARLGHDVNNLLSTIIGSLGLLREEIDSGPEGGEAQLLDDAYSAARECAALVEDLMACAGKQMLEPRAVDVNDVVARIGALLERTVPDDLAVHLTLADGLSPGLVDPDRLESVLLNITLNAREALTHGGNIHIATANVRAGAATRLAVSIRDDGPGIPEHTLGRVLEPLFSTKPAGAGRGLGLSIANGFARQSGGTLRISSAPGAGTTVTLELPAAE